MATIAYAAGIYDDDDDVMRQRYAALISLTLAMHGKSTRCTIKMLSLNQTPKLWTKGYFYHRNTLENLTLAC